MAISPPGVFLPPGVGASGGSKKGPSAVELQRLRYVVRTEGMRSF
jgi:hypothetical protein